MKTFVYPGTCVDSFAILIEKLEDEIRLLVYKKADDANQYQHGPANSFFHYVL